LASGKSAAARIASSGREIARFAYPIVSRSSVIAVSVLCLSFTQMPSARADSASCLAKAGAFVSELDASLEQETENNPYISSEPYSSLVERYFPFRDCEVEPLLDVVRQSRFIRSIYHHAPTNDYFVDFEKDPLRAWFTYRASEKRSIGADAGFIRSKP
jgi:hypothetical protein